jgi:hypothetical protein
MKFFERLFGLRKASATLVPPHKTATTAHALVEFEDGIVRIDALDFIGGHARFPSREYAMCWSDRDSATDRSG